MLAADVNKFYLTSESVITVQASNFGFDYVEKEEEMLFITARLQDILFYAVNDLPAEDKVPAKSSFKLALDYGFKTLPRTFLLINQNCLLFLTFVKMEMMRWFHGSFGGLKKLLMA